MSDRLAKTFLFLILEVFFILGLIFLAVPFTRDQGIYSYVAWRWMAGDIPYLDTFCHKGPLLYAVYAVGLKISSGAMWGPNLLDLVARTSTVLLMFMIGKRMRSPRAGVYAAAFTAMPLFSVFNSCWWNCQAETFMVPLIAFSTLLVVLKNDRFKMISLTAAGFISGQAIMLKPTGAMHFIFLAS
jgi:Dolichyl-phosphate-mannose-protein mannosyltransferase